MSSIVKVKTKGNLNTSTDFFKKAVALYEEGILDDIAKATVDALKANTPRTMDDTKIHVADSWSYVIDRTNDKISITFLNDTIVNGVNIAFILDQGHLSRSGKWVQGKNYIEEPIKQASDLLVQYLIRS